MKYLIWSNRHGKWWGPHESGYTDAIELAGEYTKEEADRIVSKGTVDGLLYTTVANPNTGEEIRVMGVVAVPSFRENQNV